MPFWAKMMTEDTLNQTLFGYKEQKKGFEFGMLAA